MVKKEDAEALRWALNSMLDDRDRCQREKESSPEWDQRWADAERVLRGLINGAES